MAIGQQRLRKIAKAADYILIAAALGCLAALCYFVYHYEWKGDREFENWPGIVVYYILPGSMAVLLLVSLRLRPSSRVNLALVLCSAGSSLVALEVLLTIWSSLPSVIESQNRRIRAAMAESVGINFDTRSKLQVVRDLQSRQVDAVPSFDRPLLGRQNDRTQQALLSAKGAPLLPLGSAAGKEVVLCNEFGIFVTYRSDSHGFNNPEGVWDRLPVDIMAVGDSFVQGWCVPSGKSFVDLIRNQYPATLNFGMEGNGPLVMLAAMKEYGPIVRPRIVLWFFFEGNDLLDLQKERKSLLLQKYWIEGFSQHLYLRQSEIDRVLADYLDELKGRSSLSIKLDEISTEFSLLLTDRRRLRNRVYRIVRFAELRHRLGLVYGAKSGADPGAPHEAARMPAELMDLFGKILKDAARVSGEWGGRVYFVYLPASARYKSEARMPDYDRDQVLESARAAGLPVIDIHRLFATIEDPIGLFPRGGFGHYTEEGHRLVADEVLRSIPVD